MKTTLSKQFLITSMEYMWGKVKMRRKIEFSLKTTSGRIKKAKTTKLLKGQVSSKSSKTGYR